MTVTLNGVEYPLRFTVNALCCLEEKTGKSLDQLQGAQMSCLRGLLWCGLMEANPAMTLQDAGDLITRHLQSGGSLSALSDALAKALEDACFFQPPGPPARTVGP
ncbi:MAG: hypothetical protein IJ662_09300 [Clostridia bacterium]|nr:hypothetical protein [Clostridia bacterium]